MGALSGGGGKGTSKKKTGLSGGTAKVGGDLEKAGSLVPSPIRSVAKKFGGALINAVQVPQQAAFRLGSGVGELVSGQPGAAASELGNALKTPLGIVGKGPKDLGFSEATTPVAAREQGLVRKLPTGVETAANFVLDPLLYTALGKGAEARKGIKVLEGLGITDASKAIQSGALDLSKGSTARKVLTDALLEGGTKEKEAAKIAKLTARRGAGGLNVFVPGTELSKNIVSGEKVGRGAARLAEGFKALPGGEAAAEVAGHVFNPIYGSTKVYGKDIAAKAHNIILGAQSGMQADKDRLISELTNSVHTVGRELDDKDLADVLHAIETGDAGIAELVGRDPKFAPMMEGVTRIGDERTRAQVARGLLGGESAASAKATEAAGNTAAAVAEHESALADAVARRKAALEADRAGQKAVTALKADKTMSSGDRTVITAQAAAARKEADAATTDLAKLRTKTAALRGAARSAAKDAEEAGLANKGVRENYAERLSTPEAIKAAERKPGGALASDVLGNISSALNQAAERARTRFPSMPVKFLNELTDIIHSGGDFRAALADTKYKKFLPEDAATLEHMARGFEEAVNELPKGAHLYQENAVASLLNRGASASRATRGYDAVQDISKITMKVGGEDMPILLKADDVARLAEEGKAVPRDWVSKELPHIGVITAHPELIKELEGVVGRIADKDFLSNLNKAMDSWREFWKAHATTGLLGALPFAMRNARSNIYLMYTDGYSFPEILGAMKRAKALEDKVRKIAGTGRMSSKFIGTHAEEVAREGLDAVLKRELTGHEYDIWKAASEKGITTSGLFPVEFSDDVYAQTRKITGQKEVLGRGGKARKVAHDVLSAKGAVATKGRDFNQGIETNARLAHFMLGVDRYGNTTEAALRTKAILFDYNDLSQVEKEKLKRIIPFYTFMRKNLPLQLETLVKNPMRVALPEKISEAASQPLPEDAADYQKDQSSRTINHLLPLFGGAISSPDRPFHAASQLLDPLVFAGQGRGQAAARSLANIPSGPIINLGKNIAEIGIGKDLFTGGGTEPGLRAGIQRLSQGQLPSLARLPRIEQGGLGPRALTGKAPKPTIDEILKFLTGLRVDRPTS